MSRRAGRRLAVIGAGAGGLSAARHLLEAGHDVVVFEAGSYGRVVHPDWPGLYFVGFFNVSGGANIAMMDVQSAWVTALESGTAGLPSPRRMRRGMARERRVLARRFPQSARYGLELDPARYRRQVAKELRRRPTTGSGRR